MGGMTMLRKHLLMFLLMALLPAMPANAAGNDAEAARHFVDEVGRKLITVISADNTSADSKQGQLRQLFAENVDIPWMGQFVLGRAWHQASEEQRSRYMQAYTQYLLTHYSTNFSSYSGSKYKITDINDDETGIYNVNMEINTPAANEGMLAGYRLRADESGRFKIVDIIIEGVSLITTERSEFNSVIRNGGIDALINDLMKRSRQEIQAK
jgi:phospholipid transport system substrate-binding protein